MLFQKGTFAYWSCFDGMVPRNLHMRGYLRQSDVQGFVVISLFVAAVGARPHATSCLFNQLVYDFLS